MAVLLVVFGLLEGWDEKPKSKLMLSTFTCLKCVVANRRQRKEYVP